MIYSDYGSSCGPPPRSRTLQATSVHGRKCSATIAPTGSDFSSEPSSWRHYTVRIGFCCFDFIEMLFESSPPPKDIPMLQNKHQPYLDACFAANVFAVMAEKERISADRMALLHPSAD